jgi:DNA-binding GntR family transcriptional regulator
VKEPLPKKIHETIHSRLVNGSIAPGSRLDYKSLARELGVSTTPVREAVAKLAREGFVDLIPRLGAVVRSLCRDTAQQLYEVREALECFAAAKAAERMSAHHLLALKKHHTVMIEVIARHNGERHLPGEQVNRFTHSDQEFHQTIFSGTRNPSLAIALGDSRIQLRIFISFARANDCERLSLACEQHEQILDALEGRDSARASAAMSAHIRQSLQLTLAHLDMIQDHGHPNPHGAAAN